MVRRAPRVGNAPRLPPDRHRSESSGVTCDNLGGMTADNVIVTTTTDSESTAQELAAAAIRARLGACAQLIGPITSVFRWEGEVQTEQEWRVEVKAPADCEESLIAQLQQHHNYDVPEIITTPITGGNPAYLTWLSDETRQ